MAHENEIYTLNDLRTTAGTTNIGGINLIQLWKTSYTESSAESYWNKRYHDINTGHTSWDAFTTGGERNYVDLLESNDESGDESDEGTGSAPPPPGGGAGFGWP